MQTLLLYLCFPSVWEKPWQRRRCCLAAAFLPLCPTEFDNKKLFYTLSISANSTFILVRLLANVSVLVPRPGDVGRAPRIPAQCFKPRRSLCFGSSDQLDSTASAAFISGSKVMADGQSLDWLQLLTRMCFASPRPASDTNRSKRVKMFVGFWC